MDITGVGQGDEGDQAAGSIFKKPPAHLSLLGEANVDARAFLTGPVGGAHFNEGALKTPTLILEEIQPLRRPGDVA